MKDSIFKLLLISCLFSFYGNAYSQEWIALGNEHKGNTVTIDVLEDKESSYKVRIRINGFYDILKNNEHGVFHSISFGENGHLMNEGEPALPLITQLIAIPSGANPKVSIEDEIWEEKSIGTLIPVQKALYDNFCNTKFCFNDSAYAKPFLPPLIQCSKVMIWHGIRNIRIQVCPFKYYPQQNKLQIAKEFILKVDFQKQHFFQKELSINHGKSHFFNNSVYSEQETPVSTKSHSKNEDYDYLIITADATILNSQKMKEFRRWKALKGFRTKAVWLNPTNNDSSYIKNYIATEYGNGVKYVLLVGDIDDITANDIVDGNNSFISDYWYGCIEGNDVEQEIPIGRFPVSSLTQFSNMVDKTIHYETWKNLDYKALLVAHNENGGYYLFESCCDSIINRDYAESLPFLTAYGHISGVTNAYVTNIINEGTHIINYRGHAAVDYWGNPEWNSIYESYRMSMIDTIQANTNAVFFSIACNTGNLEAQNCMLRAFTCSSNGAVAFLGSSTSSDHGVNNDYNKLLYKNLLDSTVYCLGDLNMKTVMDLLKGNLNLTNIEANAYSYICSGDPSLELWTATPQPINMDWYVENGNITINTNLTGNYSITIVSEDGEMLDCINCSNSISIVPIPNDYDQFYIMVHKHNYLPHIIYFDTISEEIIDKTFDYDAYYSASPMNIFAMPPTYNEKVIVKSGNKLVIKNGNQGVKIRNNFECEKGAVFEVK